MSNNKKLRHIGIIMDGNRRWAKDRGLPVLLGHQKGYENLVKVAQYCFDNGIKYLTVYAFSTENWKRTTEEVGYLMDLFAKGLSEQVEFLNKNNICMRFIGDIERFPEKLKQSMIDGQERTKNNTGGVFSLAVNYGGRAELIKAIKEIVADGVDYHDIDEDMISRHLYTKDMPDPDLIIRTSGEQRISNFLTWQSIYSEFYFSDVYWPDFGPVKLQEAIDDYDSRQRRFGN